MRSGCKATRTAGLAGLLLLGCRTIWVHPDATAEKYYNDLFFCRYGIERSEWKPEPDSGGTATDSERAWALEGEEVEVPRKMNPDWKKCMVRLGWTTSTGGRGDEPWWKPMPPMREELFP